MKKFLIVATAMALAGCANDAPEELERLRKEDPNFNQMILARDQMRAQIQLIKTDLLSRKQAMDAQIGKLRDDYDTHAKTQNEKIEKYQNAIEAYRKVLKNEIDTMSAQLQAKMKELDGYQKTMADVKKVLRESKNIQLSLQEKEKWEERILMLSEKMRPLAEEIQELKTQIRLKKRKSNFLR